MTPEQETGRQIHKSVYIIGGLLVLGLIANALGSSDGGDQCETTGCRLTFSLPPPY